MEVNKMRFLTHAELQKLSFPDCIVEDMLIDILNRELKIKINSGFLSINGGIKLRSCKLTVKNWQAINAKLYRAKTEQWENLDANNIEKLVDICEFEFGEKITFRGFGAKTGQWIEIILSKAFLEVRCD